MIRTWGKLEPYSRVRSPSIIRARESLNPAPYDPKKYSNLMCQLQIPLISDGGFFMCILLSSTVIFNWWINGMVTYPPLVLGPENNV